MRETWVPSLGQEDPLELEMATNSSILVWKIAWTEDLVGHTVHWVGKNWTQLSAHTGTLCVRQGTICVFFLNFGVAKKLVPVFL